MGGDVYLHGASPDEQQRLALMNDLINASCLEQLELAGSESVLELGAGTGLFAAEIARALGPTGRVLAIERDARQFAELARREHPRLAARQGDVYDLPLRDDERGAFDLVHARFLLEHLSDPAAAVLAMARAVRPGGRIVLIDDDHSLMRFSPDPGGMTELWRAYYEEFRRLGCDPCIGTRMLALLVAAGCEPVRTAPLNYGGCRADESFGGLVDNLARVVATARDEVIANTNFDAERFEATLRALAAWSQRPDATIWYTLPCVVGRRPE